MSPSQHAWHSPDPAHAGAHIDRTSLALICVFGTALLLPGLWNPLWTDEAYTYLHFASKGPVYIFGLYNVPNNHLLHSLCVWVVSWFGKHVLLLRLPTFLASIGLLAGTFVCAHRLTGRRWGAWMACALLVVSEYFYHYAWEARGYSLSNACVLWALAVLLHSRRQPSARSLYAVAALLALGVATVPTAIWPTGAFWIAVWRDRAVTWQDKRRFALVNLTLIVLFYLPIITYLLVAKGDAMVVQNMVTGFRLPTFGRYLIQLLQPINSVVVWVVLGLALFGVNKTSPRVLLWSCVLMPWLASSCMFVGYVRNFSYLVPLICVLFACGVVRLLSVVPLRKPVQCAVISVVFFFALFPSIRPFGQAMWGFTKVDFARELARDMGEKIDVRDAALLVDSSQVEYYLSQPLQSQFERTKRIPLQHGVLQFTHFVDRYPTLGWIVALIPELKNRASSAMWSTEVPQQIYVVMAKASRAAALSTAVEGTLTAYGYTSTTIAPEHIDVVLENPEYVLYRIVQRRLEGVM